MKPKPLTDAQKAAYKQHVKDKTLALRIRSFAGWSLKVLFGVGVLALVGFGGFYVWTLVQAKGRADQVEQRIQDKVNETQRDLDGD